MITSAPSKLRPIALTLCPSFFRRVTQQPLHARLKKTIGPNLATQVPVTDRERGIYNTRKRAGYRNKLRKSLTPAEAILWKSLQRSQLLGKKFRRQFSVGRYIVDFYCPECRPAIELDGQGHFEINADLYEVERTKYLDSAEFGF